MNYLKRQTAICKNVWKNLASLGFWWVKVSHCLSGFLSWIITKSKEIKIKNHLVIPSQRLCGYVTSCFPLWEIHPCLFSTVEVKVSKAKEGFSVFMPDLFLALLHSLAKTVELMLTAPPSTHAMIWTPVRCRWCYIIASGISVSSFQITVKLYWLCAHGKALGFHDSTHCAETCGRIASVPTCYVDNNRISSRRMAERQTESVRGNRDSQKCLFPPWGQARGAPTCFVF